MMLIPTSLGRAIGQARSKSPRTASGSRAQEGTGAEPARDAVRQDRRHPEEHQAEVLRQVPDVLDAPVGVIAERRVPVGLESVQVLVARMEEMARRRDVVGQQQADRDQRAEAGRHGSPRDRAAAADKEEERGAEDHRQSAPCRQARTAIQPRTGGDRTGTPGGATRRRRRPRLYRPRPQPSDDPAASAAFLRRLIGGRRPAGVRDQISITAERDTDGEERRCDGHDMGEEPRGSELGGVPEDRPEREEDRDGQTNPASRRAGGPAPTSTVRHRRRRPPTATARWSVASPKIATTGIRTIAGSGGNGRRPHSPSGSAAASRSGKTSWK